MSQPDQYTANTLLGAWSDDDLRLLKPHLTRVGLARRQVLVAPNKAVEHVYFPEGGVVSIVAVMAHSGRIEAGIFARGCRRPAFCSARIVRPMKLSCRLRLDRVTDR